ncbi:hypothetical protein LXL04_019578 [Taraxacum kok-saghyz]
MFEPKLEMRIWRKINKLGTGTKKIHVELSTNFANIDIYKINENDRFTCQSELYRFTSKSELYKFTSESELRTLFLFSIEFSIPVLNLITIPRILYR